MAEIQPESLAGKKQVVKPKAVSKTKTKSSKKKSSPVFLCVLFTIIAAAGIAAAIVTKNPLYIIAGMLPAAVYEAFRTQGPFTIMASVGVLLLIAVEALLIVLNVNFDLVKFFGHSYSSFSGYSVPLGDIKIAIPLLTVVLALILVIRTAGPYTKWLSFIIIVSCFVLVYQISPSEFPKMMKWAVERVMYFVGGLF